MLDSQSPRMTWPCTQEHCFDSLASMKTRSNSVDSDVATRFSFFFQAEDLLFSVAQDDLAVHARTLREEAEAKVEAMKEEERARRRWGVCLFALAWCDPT